MLQHFGRRSAHGLLELLGQLARHGHRSFGPERLHELFETLHHAVGRFVEDHRPLLRGELPQTLVASLFLGQESLETETVAGKAALHQRRNAGRRPRQRLHLDPLFDAGAHQQESRIGDTRRTRIRDQRDICALLHLFHQLIRLVHFVIFMIAGQWCLYIKMVQQMDGISGILCCDQIYFF